MSWTITRFATPLRQPGGLGVTTLAERVGFHVSLRDDHGRVGRGEASPAYWIDGCDLEALGAELAGFAAQGGPEQWLAASENDALVHLSPAARCGIETAILDLVAQQRECSVAELLGATLPVTIELSALVGGAEPTDVYEQTLARVRQGYRVLKLKVGGRIAEDDIARIQAMREATRGAALIRLDANRAWDATTAFAVLIAVANPDIELVEEPLRGSHPLELARLRRATGVPIALDESIVNPAGLTTYAECGACDTVVLKLARVGGPRAALHLAQRARELGLGVVWTDSIETRVGRQATLHTAAAAPGPCQAVGLGGVVVLQEADGEEARPRVAVTGPGLG